MSTTVQPATVRNLSQGLLIVPLAVYIAWLRRKETLSYAAMPAIPLPAIVYNTAAAPLQLLASQMQTFRYTAEHGG
jgi:hypothetical protein